jgi:hypothetical protein
VTLSVAFCLIEAQYTYIDSTHTNESEKIMKTFNSSDDLFEFTRSQPLYSITINNVEAESFWKRDDGEIVCKNEFSTISVGPPFTINYVLECADSVNSDIDDNDGYEDFEE